MKSKTKIEKQLKRKTNPKLVETILKAKKNEKWLKIANLLSRPRKQRINLNLDKINELVEEGENIVIPGKVLSQGKIDKKINLIALDFSENALEKISKKGIKYQTILEEIKKNPEAKGIKIIENA